MRLKTRITLTILTTLLGLIAISVAVNAATLPKGFVHLQDVIPNVVCEVRYFSEDNFVGARVDGYQAPVIIVTEQTANALAKVQKQLAPFGLGLKVFDGYRPQSAVDHFVRWAKDLNDIKTKDKYYPEVPKSELFQSGYVARRSSHSRGSAVDLTIVGLETGEELDMGSGFDFFSPVSWPESMAVNAQQRAHRMLLRMIMLDNGFIPYKKEWWHFNLKNEPFPDKYFDFPVE